MNAFEITERPERIRGGRHFLPSSAALYKAIRSTAKSGQAVKYPLNGEPTVRVRNRVTSYFRERRWHTRLHTRLIGTDLYFWLDPEPEAAHGD